MRRSAALLASLLLVAAGCGKYGPPVRHSRAGPTAAPAAAAAPAQTPAPTDDEREDETEKTP